MQPRFLVVAASLAAAAVPVHAAGFNCAADDPARDLQRAEVALARGDWPQAAATLACAASASPDAAVAERATRLAFENDQLTDAVASARRWLALQPGREEARRFLATSLLRLHQDDAAAEQFQAVLLTAYPDRAQGYMALLGTLSAEANDTGAARVMDRLARLDPALAEAQYARSVLWQQAENGAKALDAAQRALQARPDWRQAELARIRALLLLGRTEEGLSLAAAAAADGDTLSQLNYAWLLAGARRNDESRAAFEELRRTQAAVPQALEGLGSLAYTEGDYESAARYFTELVQASRGDTTALFFLGLVAEDQGKPALALRYLERVDTGPRAVASQLRALRIMESLGATERAELLLADFLDRSPDSARDVLIGRANQLADAGRGDAAVAMLRRAQRYYPDDDGLRLAEGFLLERLDRVAESIAVMRDVLRRRPDDPTTLNSLGYTLVDRTSQVRAGYELIRRALEARPDSYAIVDSAGWALFRLGRNVEALELLQRAWSRSQDPEVAAHLGEVLWAEDRREEARELWRRAAEDAPDNRSLQRVMERHPG